MTCNYPTVRQQELGDGLRMLRTQAGFTLDDAARIIHCSASKLSRLETGHRHASIDDIAGLLGLYHAEHGQRSRILALAREADETGWLQSHPGSHAQRHHTLSTLTSYAEQIVHFDPVMIPGVLQTSEYTQAVQAESGVAPTIEQDHSAIRRKRRCTLNRCKPPELLAILDESVLHRPWGGHGVLRHQLEHLRTTSAESHRMIRVLPGGQRITTGPFTLLRLADRSPVIHLEHPTCSLFLEQPHDIDAYEHALKHLDEYALDETDSLEMISQVSKNLEVA